MKTPSIFKKKRDQAYYAVINGKHKYLGKDYDVALAKARQLAGTSVATGSEYPLSQAIEEYMTFCRVNHSPDTVRNKRSCYKAFLSRIGDVDIQAITAEDCEQYRDELLETRTRPTVNTVHVRMSALFEYWVKKKVVTQNPWHQVKKLKVANNLDIDRLTDEEIEKLYALARRSRFQVIRESDKLMISLMVNCGLRCIEVSRLRWSDIKLDKRTLVVQEGKGTKSRIIPLNDEVHKHLIEGRRFCDYVICSLSKRKVSRSCIRHRANKFVEELGHTYKGKQRLKLHGLRSTFATRLAEAGVSAFVIRDLMGHSDVKTTEKYVQSCFDNHLEAVNRICR